MNLQESAKVYLLEVAKAFAKVPSSLHKSKISDSFTPPHLLLTRLGFTWGMVQVSAQNGIQRGI